MKAHERALAEMAAGFQSAFQHNAFQQPPTLAVWNADGSSAAAFSGTEATSVVWNADGFSAAAFSGTAGHGKLAVWNADGVAAAAFSGQAVKIIVGPKRIIPAPKTRGTYTPDIRLVQYTNFPTSLNIDWLLLGDGTLDDTQALATAVIVALGTNRLALSSDILPDPDSTDRQGWWADLDVEEIWNGWPIGCRLWLLKRSKITGPEAIGGATVTLVEMYIREALQPFIELKIASQMDVRAVRVGLERIDARVRLYRGPQLAVDLQYQMLWDEITGAVTANAMPQQIATQPQRMIAGPRR